MRIQIIFASNNNLNFFSLQLLRTSSISRSTTLQMDYFPDVVIISLIYLMAQEPKIATVRKPAPYFRGNAYFEGNFVEIDLKKLIAEGQWIVLFFWPLDFTFVCPTQIRAFSEKADLFTAAGAKLIGCSVDSTFSHMAWSKSKEKGALGVVQYPMLSDIGGKIARRYGCLIEDGNDEGVAFRATYIIDPKGILRHLSINDLPVGRNPEQVLRLVKALQHADEFGEVCPANWKPGDKAIVPGINKD